MFQKIAILGLRFILIAAIYISFVVLWVNNAVGWDGIGLLGAGIAASVAAVPSWWGAVIIGQFISDRRLRAIAHPVLTVLLFMLIAAVTVIVMGTTFESMWRDVRPFAALLAVAAVADACAGFLLETWQARRSSSVA
jgi:hypothetical protein